MDTGAILKGSILVKTAQKMEKVPEEAEPDEKKMAESTETASGDATNSYGQDEEACAKDSSTKVESTENNRQPQDQDHQGNASPSADNRDS